MSRPRARADGLVVQELADETLVYDLERHRAHCLDRAMAEVWRLCDGRRDVPALARQLAKAWGEPVDEGLVRHCLVRLGRARLLSAPLAAGRDGRLTRREWTRRAALTLPALITIAAPTALQAASCPDGGISPSQCKPSNPQFAGCCCSNSKICNPADNGNCTGNRCRPMQPPGGTGPKS